MLYAFGSNGSGQLGVGHTDDLSNPKLVLIENDRSTDQIKQLAAGGNHTLILFKDGVLQATGNNEDGRCGIKDHLQHFNFTTVGLPLGGDGTPLIVNQVAATWSSTTILCDDGHLYVCGTGNSGELGLGLEIENTKLWRMIPEFPPPGKTIRSIASSMAHTAAVLSDGDVYGWGKGRKGQLGEPAQDIWSPRKIEDIHFAATSAVCGRDFTFVVGQPSTPQILILGAGGNDRFGLRSNIPASLPDRTQIAASWCSSYILEASGHLVAWGRNDHGQLPLPDLPELTAIAAGSEHCLALSKTGKVLAWGWSEHGNCGLPVDDRGDVRGRWNEIDILGRVAKIFAGCATSFILTDE